jgi:hypothetical protein
MAIADASQADRLFTGELAHPRQAIGINLQTRLKTCPPRDHRCDLQRERSAIFPRTATGRDAGHKLIRTPPHTGILTIRMAFQR